MKKLLYIANQRFPTEKAYGIQIAKMCEAFATERVDVQLLVPIRETPIVENLFEYYSLKENFKVERVRTLDFDWPGKMLRLSFYVKMFLSAICLWWRALFSGADVIYSRDESTILMLSLFRGGLYYEAHKISRSKYWIYKFFIFQNIKIVAITGAMRDEFISTGFVPDNVTVEHDGVDLSQFVINNDKISLRKKLGLTEGRFLVGYVGHLTTMGMEKGVGDLFKAIKILQKNNPNIQLVVVGGTEEDINDYKKRIIDIDVVFTGHKSHNMVPDYLNAFDILAMPYPRNRHYAYYMSPLKMFEYMASGKPIVATRLPSVEEVLNSENSVLVEPNSSEAFAVGIRKIVNDVDFGCKIGEQALKDVQNYTWQKRAQRIIDFIKRSSNKI